MPIEYPAWFIAHQKAMEPIYAEDEAQMRREAIGFTSDGKKFDLADYVTLLDFAGSETCEQFNADCKQAGIREVSELRFKMICKALEGNSLD